MRCATAQRVSAKRKDQVARHDAAQRRVGFAVKVLGNGGLASHDTRRWQSGPDISVSIAALHRVLDYLQANRIHMYRMSSDFVPYSTHPDMPQFHRQIEDNAGELARIGRYAAQFDIRLSLHPSQYIVLNAEDDAIVAKTLADLDSQARLLDAMQQGAEAVVVTHVGGVYGDRQAALDRFAANADRLSEPARRRLVIENDETSFHIADCLWLHQRTGLPVVFDHQHHRLNPGGLDVHDAARAALRTWPHGVVPKIHFSSPRLDGREVKRGSEKKLEAPQLRQHADYVDPWTLADFVGGLGEEIFDIMLEAKAKDLALLKLRADLRRIGREDVLQQGRAG